MYLRSNKKIQNYPCFVVIYHISALSIDYLPFCLIPFSLSSTSTEFYYSPFVPALFSAMSGFSPTPDVPPTLR